MRRKTTSVLQKGNSSIRLSIDNVFLKINDLHLIFKLNKDLVKFEIIPVIKIENVLNIANHYWVNLSAIPQDIRAKFHINELEVKAKYFALFPKAQQKNNHLIYLYHSLEVEMHKSFSIEELLRVAEFRLNRDFNGLINSIQAFTFLVDLKTITIEDKFFLYYRLIKKGPENIAPLFITNSLNVFKNKLSSFKKNGWSVFIHGNYNNKNASVKFDDVDIEILKGYKNGFRESFRTLMRRLNTNRLSRGERRVSLQTVISAIKNMDDYGVMYLQRNGSEAINDLLLHPARIQPEFPGDQYQIDGTRFNIPFLNEEGRPDIFILVALIDVYSNKIMGYTLTKSENFNSYYQVISQSVKETGFLPAEILSDNLPALKSKESVVYLSKLKKCGVLIRQHTVLNPSDKSFIESWFGTFSQLFLKNIPGFLGDGIKSKRKDGKPNSDIIEKYRNKRELRTKRELDELLKAKIIEYNSTREYKNSTPNSLFANSIIKNGKKVDENLSRIILFNEKTCELTKAGIRLQVNNKLHEYLIYTDNIPFFYKYLNKEITIRYNPLDMDVIYLYPTDSFFHIATLNLHVNFPLAQVSQTEDDRNRIKDFSLKRYAVKKKLLNISKQSQNKEKDEEVLPIELISEKYDSKELVTNSVKEYLLPKDKKQKKALKINYNQTFDESVPSINLSLGKMFNLPGSNKLIN